MVTSDIMIGISNNFFEPTYTIFDNAIVLGYKKSATRFFAHMASYPINHWEHNHQYDLCMLRIDGSHSNTDNRCLTKTICGNYITSINFGEGHDNTCPNYDVFFEKNGVKNMNEFLFENSKITYAIIRNPVDRFLSGIVQVFGAYVDELLELDEEKERIKKQIKITDEEILNVKTYLNDVFNLHYPNKESNKKLDKFAVSKIISYIIQNCPHLYLQDVHTQNYLFGIKEIIYNIKDKSKVRILDLADCKSKSAFDLYNTWSNTQNFDDIYKNINDYVLSNKIIYDYIFKYDINNNNLLAIRSYLNVEFAHYDSLRKSEFYLNLKQVI